MWQTMSGIGRNLFCCLNVWVRYQYLTTVAAKSSVTDFVTTNCLARLQERVGLWFPMEKKGPQALTGTELNAAVYRYLQESGFVHTAFNFFYEAGIGKGNIQEMIPQGALIRIVQKGLQYVELEANSEIGSDDEHHFFESLDLMTNDLDELTKKITSSGKHCSVKNDKEQKVDSVETDKAQKIGSAETATTYSKQPMRKTKAAQNSKADETATMPRAQPVKHVKAQNISSAETVEKTCSVENATGLGLYLSWIGRKPRLRKRKH